MASLIRSIDLLRNKELGGLKKMICEALSASETIEIIVETGESLVFNQKNTDNEWYYHIDAYTNILTLYKFITHSAKWVTRVIPISRIVAVYVVDSSVPPAVLALQRERKSEKAATDKAGTDIILRN